MPLGSDQVVGSRRLDLLLCRESIERNSWNPVLAEFLRHGGLNVVEMTDLDAFAVAVLE